MNNPLNGEVTGFKLGGGGGDDDEEGEDGEEKEEEEDDDNKRKTVSRGLHNIADDLVAGQEKIMKEMDKLQRLQDECKRDQVRMAKIFSRRVWRGANRKNDEEGVTLLLASTQCTPTDYKS